MLQNGSKMKITFYFNKNINVEKYTEHHETFKYCNRAENVLCDLQWLLNVFSVNRKPSI